MVMSAWKAKKRGVGEVEVEVKGDEEKPMTRYREGGPVKPPFMANGIGAAESGGGFHRAG